MIGQILAHLVGDYIFQTDRMATLKAKQWRWALIHAVTYTLPFLFLTRSPIALAIICLTHAIIDRYRLARYVVAFKNSLTDWNRRSEFFSTPCGYAVATPPWMAIWLLIITDNTMHLLVNAYALAAFAK